MPTRLQAVRAFAALPEAERAGRGQQADRQHPEENGERSGAGVDRGRLADGAEHDLYAAFEKLDARGRRSTCDAATTPARCRRSARRKPAVDRFFDDVMVMADDPALRANRLALLRGVARR